MVGLYTEKYRKRFSNTSKKSAEEFDQAYHTFDQFLTNSWHRIRNNLFPDSFKIDVQDQENQYWVEAELPGIEKEEIHLELQDELLIISVIRDESRSVSNSQKYLYRERNHVSMQRTLYLDQAINTGIKATLANGVLKICIPREKGSLRRSPIKIE